MTLAFFGLLVTDVGFIDAAPKPNVLFLAVDDMRDWVGCLGGYKAGSTRQTLTDLRVKECSSPMLIASPPFVAPRGLP